MARNRIKSRPVAEEGLVSCNPLLCFDSAYRLLLKETEVLAGTNRRFFFAATRITSTAHHCRRSKAISSTINLSPEGSPLPCPGKVPLAGDSREQAPLGRRRRVAINIVRSDQHRFMSAPLHEGVLDDPPPHTEGQMTARMLTYSQRSTPSSRRRLCPCDLSAATSHGATRLDWHKT